MPGNTNIIEVDGSNPRVEPEEHNRFEEKPLTDAVKEMILAKVRDTEADDAEAGRSAPDATVFSKQEGKKLFDSPSQSSSAFWGTSSESGGQVDGAAKAESGPSV